MTKRKRLTGVLEGTLILKGYKVAFRQTLDPDLSDEQLKDVFKEAGEYHAIWRKWRRKKR